MTSWNPISPYTPISLFWALLGPWIFLSLSVSHIPATVSRLYHSSSLSTLLSPSSFKSAWFGTFWATVGPNVRDNNWARIVALLDGRVSAGQISETRVSAPVSGAVLEVGPGVGLWAGLYAEPSLRGEDSSDDSVYGVEPSTDMHPQLRASIAKAGLDGGVYEIVPVGIESLASSGRVQKESVDAIVSILCLCSIPDPESNIRELYGYLKPGGRWYVFEHVKCLPQRGWGMWAYQAVVNLFWPHCLGGCELRRDTERSLRAAGKWKSVDLVYTEGDEWCTVCPHIFGTLTK
ncbi:methyltransferase domain-containing protein [Coniochaeta ligniaria NRRL 30616]|uniref:Methyltransferase domain-containing protein n=1 Tax=Coniochaeta ligniaria NRRL 30616 TaxID=1408157 RepID=A0A1J7I807_9PEZI|nr:methyltransferase domain-containing protein [Coniochaeta ligniaria NRRL 30616]